VPSVAGWVVVALLCIPTVLAAQQEVIVAVQVHGNTITASEDIVRASGLTVGAPFSEKLLSDASTRLEEMNAFESIDVLKRYASISDPTQIMVVIQVDEGPVRVEVPDIEAPPGVPPAGKARVVRRSRLNVMFVPILTAQDGYGLTYGAQFAIAGHSSPRRRLVLPASWGGDKRVGAEYQQEFSTSAAPRLRTGASLQRRTHPFFDDDADRKRIWGRADWSLMRQVRAGTEVAWESTSLAGEENTARSVGADVTVDTRVDPLMPRNAVFLRAGLAKLRLPERNPVRTELDANVYLGLIRGAVLSLRGLRENFSEPAPAFYKSVLGGTANLRGFRAGHAVGDTLVAGSAEIRVPTTSPLRMARFGYSVFIDIATAYDKGQKLEDQKMERGVGAGIWATAPLFRISFAVARGLGSGTRAHIGAGLTF